MRPKRVCPPLPTTGDNGFRSHRRRRGVVALASPRAGIDRPEPVHFAAGGTGLDVGRWVLRTACLQIVAWEKQGFPPLRLAVNVSAQQFYRGDIVKTVDQILCETGLDPERLELELTESLTLDDSDTTLKIMRELKRIG